MSGEDCSKENAIPRSLALPESAKNAGIFWWNANMIMQVICPFKPGHMPAQ
jgi:hypothetical protein